MEGFAMETKVRKFFKESNNKRDVIILDDLWYGIDYEVVSETIFDYEGNEYLFLDEVPESIRAEGDYIKHPDLVETNIAVSLGGPINLRCAKKCKLGVIQLLTGKEKVKQILFPVYDMDLEVQWMGYEVLTIGRVFRPFIKIIQNPQHLKYIRMVLGVTAFEEDAKILNLETLG
jgi:hypothetical protein